MLDLDIVFIFDWNQQKNHWKAKWSGHITVVYNYYLELEYRTFGFNEERVVFRLLRQKQMVH